MTRKRINKNPRRSSTDDERSFSTLITMLRAQKKKVLSIASIPLWIRLSKYFWLSLLFRLISAFFIFTEFVPDEAWQSTEVAYYYTWGPGSFGGDGDGTLDQTHGHLTWEWIVGLRNHLYPFIIATFYHGLKFCGLDTPYSLVMVPRLLQATLTALGDYCLFLYATSRFGKGAGRWALMVSISNWFVFYTGPRTITNSAEMALNSIALFLFERDQMVLMVGVVALNFVIRPTAIVIWIPQVFDLWPRFFQQPTVPFRLPGAIFMGLLVLSGGALLDSWVFGNPVISWLRFLKFNVFQGGATQFGEHHILWYFYSALPSIFGLGLLPLVVSLSLRFHQKDWIHILGFVFIFSLLPHKEIRFLLPILPIMMALVGDVIQKCWQLGDDKNLCKKENVDIHRLVNNWFILYLLSNTVACLYFCGFHQGGIVPSTQFVNTHSSELKNPHIWVVMQCYTIPVYTYMHNPSATFEMMTCAPPNLEGIGLDYSLFPNYNIYSNFTIPPNVNATALPPGGSNATALAETAFSTWVEAKLSQNGGRLPDFILCFKAVCNLALRVMQGEEIGGSDSYEKCFSHPHAQFGEDRGYVWVLCRKGIVKMVAPAPPPPSPQAVLATLLPKKIHNEFDYYDHVMKKAKKRRMYRKKRKGEEEL